MKLERNQWILVALLIGQVALSAFVLWPRVGTAGTAEPLFPGLKDADVVGLTVSDNTGKSIELRKTTGAWVLPSADDYPADETQITSIVDKVKVLSSQRLVTQTEASQKQLQVSATDFLRRVTLSTADGTSYVLYVGSAPTYDTSHVRPEGTNNTYLVSDLSQWDLSVNALPWVKSSYFSVAQNEVEQVTLTNVNGTFTFKKDATGTWALEGLTSAETPNTAEVNSVITKATQVTMLRPLGRESLAEYGLDRPTATVIVKKADESIVLTVGAKDATDSSYVVNVSTSPYYVRVSEYNVQSLVEDTRSSFILPPATPTPNP